MNRIQELEAQLDQGKTAVECLAILVELAELHAAASRNWAGIRCAREALKIARGRNDRNAAGRALTAAMHCHHQLGDFVTAIANGRDAVQSFGEEATALRSHALQGVARALVAIGSLKVAAEATERAAADARLSGDPSAEAGVAYLSGSILARRGSPSAARPLFRQAGALQRRLRNALAVKKCATSIANGYLAQAEGANQLCDYNRARVLWRHAIRVFRVAIATGQSPPDDAIAIARIAECEIGLEKRDQALATARQAIELAGRSRSPLALASCHLWESHALRVAGNVDAARRACEYARGVAEQLDHDPILGECLRAEAMLNDLCGRFETAQDLEQRAERVGLEREAILARARDEAETLLAQHPSSAVATLGVRVA